MRDADRTWRLIYRTDDDAIVIAHVFERRSAKTPQNVIDVSRRRLAAYEREG